MTEPALLAISHGTASLLGQAAIQRLVDAVAERMPEVTVRLGHVDVQQPDVAASLAALPGDAPVVIVPLLLSAGYHVRIDLRQQSAGRPGVTIAPALGPDPRLVDVLVERLDALAAAAAPRRAPAERPADPDAPTDRPDVPGDPRGDDDFAIVLAVAGSSDERANDDCRAIGAMLAERLRREVTVGFLAAAEPRLDAVVERAVSGGHRVVVANYLLAPGYFHDLAVRLAGDSAVARPLLDDDAPATALVEIVVDRYRATV